MGEKDEVFDIVRSVILSKKGGVLLQNVNRDYKSLAGEHVPYVKLGYKCMEDLLDDISEIKKSVDDNGHTIYTSIGKNCEHLAKLISKQKTTTSSPKYVKPSCKNNNYPNNQNRTRINYSKAEETTLNNEYHSKKLPKDIDCRNAKSKLSYKKYEPEFVENMKKTERSHYVPLHSSELTIFDDKLLSARQRDRNNLHRRPFSSFKEPIFRKETYYRGNGNKSDKPMNKYPKHPDIDKIHSRNIPEACESVNISRYMSHNQRSYFQHLENQRRYSVEEDEEYFQWLRNQTPRYTDRKIDLIGGSLRVTIKNDY